MGCGGSKGPTDAPDINTIQVAEFEAGYPDPKPPGTRKKDVFIKENHNETDQQVSKVKVTDDMTYEGLLALLTKDLKSDLEKVRAIFYFIGSQNIEAQWYPGINDPHLPRGYMKLIKLKKGQYHAFFALLCRAAGLPCVILRGKGKSAEYEVGDEDVSDLPSSWNAVYVDGQWRIVHPLWAFTGIRGFSSGRWMKIEEQGKQTRERAKASKGTHVACHNEFWFIPDPDQFVYFCIADDSKWQLLEKPWTIQNFTEVPYFRSPYFQYSDMTLSSSNKGVLESEDGKVEIAFDHDEQDKSNVTYALFFDESESSENLPKKEELPRCVFYESTEKGKRFIYRFKATGVYKTSMYNSGAPIVSFKIQCKETVDKPKLFPANPDIGFGYGHTAKEAGLDAPTQVEGVVQTDKNKENVFQFRISEQIELEARLIHNDIAVTELQKYVRQERKDDKVTITVDVPENQENGEFALQVYTKEGNKKSNVVNYLLTDNKDEFKSGKDKEKEKERERERNRLRQLLKDAIKSNDSEQLKRAIEEFEVSYVPDKDGDLPVAKKKLQELLKHDKIRRQLKDATRGTNTDKLKEAIDDFERAKVKDTDGDLPKAKKRLDDLNNMRELKMRLKKAMRGDDERELEAAIAAYERAEIPDDDGDLDRAKQRLEELRDNRMPDLEEDELQELRDRLRSGVRSRDLGQLEDAIRMCELKGMGRDQEVVDARKLLVKLYEKALEDGMKDRDVDRVRKLVKAAKVSPVSEELSQSHVLAKAERFLVIQGRLQKYMGIVLDLKPSTVSEIHRYPKPHMASYQAVVATYLILGENRSNLKQWNSVRNLLRMSGPRGIIRRIKHFGLEDLKAKRARDAKGRLDRYSLDEVKMVSAGAAAFYVWSSNILTEEIPEEADEENIKVVKSANRADDDSDYRSFDNDNRSKDDEDRDSRDDNERNSKGYVDKNDNRRKTDDSPRNNDRRYDNNRNYDDRNQYDDDRRGDDDDRNVNDNDENVNRQRKDGHKQNKKTGGQNQRANNGINKNGTRKTRSDKSPAPTKKGSKKR